MIVKVLAFLVLPDKKVDRPWVDEKGNKYHMWSTRRIEREEMRAAGQPFKRMGIYIPLLKSK